MLSAPVVRVFLFMLLCGLGYTVQAESGFAGLVAGKHHVGVRIVQQYDYARGYKGSTDLVTGKPTTGERARPIQTLVWYPAQKGGTPIRYADYVRSEATDENFTLAEAEADAFLASKRQWFDAKVGPKQAQALLNQRMWAVRNAPAAAGKFPVVIYAAGGGGTAYENADLCEYLASQGYLVLASRNLGTRTRTLNIDEQGLESTARDIEFLLAYAQTLPQADMAHIAVVGWSWGGLANALVASQDSRVKALVSFDGTQQREFAQAVSRTQLNVPWLYVQRRPESVRELSANGMETSSILLNEAKYADLYHVVMNPMEHPDFMSLGLRAAQQQLSKDYSRAEVEKAYYWTCQYTLHFLNANLKGDATGRQFLDRTPTQNGVPAHMARQYHLPAQLGPAPTQAGFAAALATEGFGHALEIYRRMQQQDASFTLSEGTINTWGYQLMRNAHDLPAALAIFRLGTELYPTSFNLFDSLAEADEHNQDTASAIAHYRRSLELNPQNTNATQRLRVLGATATGSASK
ncbi:alpha/beta fold hydrolase [Hymenobacter wooponensis]|uniref:Dienelactone hydrolase n=1 Tax=Hymenobacter wooponensis TaxID=1525360 RepID=A0A4Z0MV68_9BACT|nr:alpha/beta fold hydrolase [Hymenobacter wooponensis]TGD83218.1 dienelactone hydrolase [Hymenobacter wooponensis]